MVNRNLIRSLDLSEEEWESELAAALETHPTEEMASGAPARWPSIKSSKAACFASKATSCWSTSVIRAKASSSAASGKRASRCPSRAQIIKVLIEDVEDIHGLVDDSRGMITLSKRKAEKIEAWLKVMETVHEGDVVTGVVTRKIKGGLLVDIGVNVFLPASQVDIRRPADIGDYIGRHHPVPRAEDRRSAAEHRRQPPRADRSGAGGEEGPVAGRAGSGPAPQGRREEHRRVRRLRRPRRHRRPAAHHRHELGPHQPPLRNGGHRPGNRSADPAHRLREGEDRPGPEAEDAPAPGKTSRRSIPSASRSAAPWST